MSAEKPIAITIAVAPGLEEGASLSLRLLGEDSFINDDAVTLLRPTARHVSVQMDLPELIAAPVRKALTAVSGAIEVPRGQPAHVMISADDAQPRKAVGMCK
jgi:hypothetical protein